MVNRALHENQRWLIKRRRCFARENRLSLAAMVPTEFSPEAFTEHMSDYNHATWVRDEAAGVSYEKRLHEGL